VIFFSLFETSSFRNEREKYIGHLIFRAPFIYHRAWRVSAPTRSTAWLFVTRVNLFTSWQSAGEENRSRRSSLHRGGLYRDELSWRASDRNCAGGRPENRAAPSRIIYPEVASHRLRSIVVREELTQKRLATHSFTFVRRKLGRLKSIVGKWVTDRRINSRITWLTNVKRK